MKSHDRLEVNSLTEQRQPVWSPAGPQALDWALSVTDTDPKLYLKPPPEVSLADWKHPAIGWGLILPYRSGLNARQLASADDAPEPIRQLREARNNAPVFRYRPGWGFNATRIKNYAAPRSVPLSGGKMGAARDALPYYLLICATPEEIPWQFQYQLNMTHAVGRLDLTPGGLKNYVRALLVDWRNAEADSSSPIVWAAENNDEITRLMRAAIAQRIFAEMKKDEDLTDKARLMVGGEATCENLIAALEEAAPGLIITTSHGRTHPWTKPPEMRSNLGRMMDVNNSTLDLKKLLLRWQPDGAVWYAHACCSAGSDAHSVYAGLVEEQSGIGQLLKAVAGLGSGVAPLPRALLGARRPLRCFIGHVEPTFNWILRQPGTPDHLTAPLCKALYNELYWMKPVGLALQQLYRHLAALSSQHDTERKKCNQGAGNNTVLIYTRLAQCDIKSTVILGDPVVTLPPLPRAGADVV